MERNQCVAGANGGFFDVRTFRPNGLLIADGKRYGEFDRKNWAAGVLAVRKGVLTLADQAQFTPDDSVTQLLQTGPWLVRGGTSQWGFTNDDSPARRTFLATDGAGTWLLGHVGGCTLLELSILLTSPPLKQILPIHEALNLDGGSSSAFWIEGTPPPTYIHEKAIVRNYVGIRPRKTATAIVR
jgi:exopolysaccharide biosynthesis protein